MHALSPNDGALAAFDLSAPYPSSTGRLGASGYAGWRRFLAECCLAVWVTALLTFCAYVLRPNLTTAGFLYLLTVVVVAQTCGLSQATLTSVIAVACLDYFIVPPIFSFELGSTQNLVALATFEFCALIVSRLSA